MSAVDPPSDEVDGPPSLRNDALPAPGIVLDLGSKFCCAQAPLFSAGIVLDLGSKISCAQAPLFSSKKVSLGAEFWVF